MGPAWFSMILESVAILSVLSCAIDNLPARHKRIDKLNRLNREFSLAYGFPDAF
jgi:hypothetical protein